MATEVKRVITIETQQSENSINSLNRDIKTLKKTLGDLTIGTEEYIKVQTELAAKQKTLKEANSSLRAEARTTAKRLETIQKSAGSLASAYSALNAAMALVGKQSGDLDKVFLKIQSGIALAQGIGGIKDLLQEIPNLINDFKNLGSVIGSVFNKLPFNNLNKRLDEAALKIANLSTKQPNINITAGAASGAGEKTIVQQNTGLQQQQKTLVPLNEQWAKYIKNQKEVLANLKAHRKVVLDAKNASVEYIKLINQLSAARELLSRRDSNKKALKSEEQTTSNSLTTTADRINKLNKELEQTEKQINKTVKAINKAEFAATSLGKAWSVAKSVFSTVGWTLLISAVLGAAYKLIDYIKNLNKAREAQKQFNKELNSSIANISGKSLSNFYELAEAYKRVGDSAEKKAEFLKTYTEQIKATGLAIESVNDADAAFISNTDNYVNAIIARAEIDAYREKITQKTRETLEANLELERQLTSGEAEQLTRSQRFALAGAGPNTDLQSYYDKFSRENKKAVEDQIAANKKALNDFVKDSVDRISTLKVQFASFWERPKKEIKPSGGTSKAETSISIPDDISAEYEAVWGRINAVGKSSREKELAELDEFYKSAIELAKQYGDDYTQIQNAWGKERQALLDKYNQEDLDKLTKQYNEQINIIKQNAELSLKELNNTNFFHSTPLFGFQWQTGSDIDKEYEQAVNNAKKILEITKDRINQENSLIDEQLETLELTEEAKEKLLKQKAQNRIDLTAAETQYEVSLTEAANKKKQKSWQVYSATVEASASLFGGVADAVSAIWGEQSKAAKGFQAAQAVFNALSAANGAYSSLASIPYVGPALGAAAAAAALASGYANVKAIYSTSADGSNVSTAIATPPALSTTPVSYTKELIGDKEKDIINQPVKCYVLEQDITASQNKVQVRENNTSF